MKIEFIDNLHPLYPAVKKLGKKYNATLGFMPEGGFDDYAVGKCIITASEGDTLQGYLMYRRTSRFGRIAIVHLAVDEPYRRSGVSTALLDTLCDKFKDSGASGMVLNCREDFKKPSKLWERYGFIAKGQKRSRSYETHYLTTWWYGFDQRDLFSLAYEESDKVRAMMDANIIMKLRDAETEHTQPLDPKEDPRCLLADWLVEETDLCYAAEIFNEIYRDPDLARRSRTNNFISNFAQAPYNVEEQKQMARELKNILTGRTDNDESDRKQVATCIAAGIPYFITYDAEIIKKKVEIEDSYDIEILTPQEFLIKIDQLLHSEKYSPVLLQGVAWHTMSKPDSKGFQQCVESFRAVKMRERKLDFENAVNGCVNCGGEVFTIRNQGKDVAFGGVSIDEEETRVHFLRVAEGPLCTSLFCQIVTDLLRKCVKEKRKRIVMEDKCLPVEQHSFLVNFGFQEQGNTLVKEVRDEIVTKDSLPWKELNQQELLRVESVFFPLKISDLDIPCYIVPIRAYWAGQLFDSVISGGQIFGADPSRLWSFENVYYRHTRPITERAPARILWYVSHDKEEHYHSMMVVGCSYLTEVYTDKPKVLYKMFKHYGIYEWSDIYKLCEGKTEVNIRALKFSHTELFAKPIRKDDVNKVLVKHGHGKSTFPSPLKVKREVFFELYRMGKGVIPVES
ncbi:MAG: GNAT family N-acetyltransferase [Bacteroidales bacterium]|nr:GNAT family N-acetyltransferase [Bacteroidales bacterium]